MRSDCSRPRLAVGRVTRVLLRYDIDGALYRTVP